MKTHIKKSFNLAYSSGSTKLFNIFPYSDSTLNAYKIPDDEKDFLIIISKAYEKTKRTDVSKIIAKHLNEIVFVKMEEYPLPGFVTKDFTPVINLSVVNATQLTDYRSQDIFSLCAYSYILSTLMSSRVFKQDIEDLIVKFFISVFMKMFGKKAGLIGSYKNLIPKLKFLTSLYVREGILGEKITENHMKKIASKNSIDYKSLDTKYDFSDIGDFLKSITKNRIIDVSSYSFSTRIINLSGVGGIASLAMFEDISRLFATLIAGKVQGNKIFSSYWIKISKEVYEKVLNRGAFLFLKGAK